MSHADEVSPGLQFEVRARQLWSRLPEPLVTSPILVRSIRRAAQVVRRHPGQFRVVRTLAEVDEMLERIERAAAISDDELHRQFRSFRMEVEWTFPPDPFSDGYRRSVLECYEWLRGQPYTNDNEHVPFDVVEAVENPFPTRREAPARSGSTTWRSGKPSGPSTCRPVAGSSNWGPVGGI